MLEELESLGIQIAKLNAIKLTASEITQRHLSMVISDLITLGEGTRLKLGLDVAGSELDASSMKMCESRVATALSTSNGVTSIVTTEGRRDLADKGSVERKDLTFDSVSRYRHVLMVLDPVSHRERVYMPEEAC
ncbi:hypothetical protein B5807_06795 [Epicoccum nigrum]|uniref:Uncharacterized protein n=1 Tax=Epicoccum nigrum TaxID=105696 RepID=A0A1Y2LYP9_EPING|nr:hypothetical protein B5807_06795 [Epicoccum nigrum]